jgi:predicted amidohydrolase
MTVNGRIKVAAGQIAPKSLEPERNIQTMVDMIHAAGAEGARLIIFPELSDSGYLRWPEGREALLEVEKIHSVAAPIPSPRTDALAAAAREQGIIVVAGLLEAHATTKGRIFDTAVLIDADGTIKGCQRKVTNPLNEFFYYARGDTITVHETSIGDVGMSICYDNLFPETTRVQVLLGMDVSCMLFNHCPEVRDEERGLVFGWPADLLKAVVRTRAAENGVTTIFCNRTGYDEFSGLHFRGGSIICNAFGEVVAEADDSEQSLVGEVDLSSSRTVRGLRPVLKDRRPELYSVLAEGP